MRLLCILVLLLCLYGPQGAEGKKENGNKQQDKKGKNKSIPSSGELITKDNHRCTWETSGEGEVSLLLNCIEEDKTYWCRFTGQPELCSNYNSKSSVYWKQVVGKVKKKNKNACEGDKVLKTRICKKGPAESHMKLSEKSGAAGEAPEKGKGKGSRKKDSGSESSDIKKEKKPQELEKDDFREVNDGNSESEEPVENYCADNWHSVCSFFVKFLDG